MRSANQNASGFVFISRSRQSSLNTRYGCSLCASWSNIADVATSKPCKFIMLEFMIYTPKITQDKYSTLLIFCSQRLLPVFVYYLECIQNQYLAKQASGLWISFVVFLFSFGTSYGIIFSFTRKTHNGNDFVAHFNRTAVMFQFYARVFECELE